jgi:hypothetical protein
MLNRSAQAGTCQKNNLCCLLFENLKKKPAARARLLMANRKRLAKFHRICSATFHRKSLADVLRWYDGLTISRKKVLALTEQSP